MRFLLPFLSRRAPAPAPPVRATREYVWPRPLRRADRARINAELAAGELSARWIGGRVLRVTGTLAALERLERHVPYNGRTVSDER